MSHWNINILTGCVQYNAIIVINKEIINFQRNQFWMANKVIVGQSKKFYCWSAVPLRCIIHLCILWVCVCKCVCVCVPFDHCFHGNQVTRKKCVQQIWMAITCMASKDRQVIKNNHYFLCWWRFQHTIVICLVKHRDLKGYDNCRSIDVHP